MFSVITVERRSADGIARPGRQPDPLEADLGVRQSERAGDVRPDVIAGDQVLITDDVDRVVVVPGDQIAQARRPEGRSADDVARAEEVDPVVEARRPVGDGGGADR